MTEAILPKAFKGIDTAAFDTSYDVSNLIGATLIDSLEYITYTKEEAKAFSAAGESGEKEVVAPKEPSERAPVRFGEARTT
jgi:hypothetical protein